ncbi:cytochrome c oxidase assembly factor 4 homolog, mitochondrial-like [Choloepus didactylus]|uniref:cytochrome c oxidase assembly factor 4 homolog, mitochondrial-like n=1 Tax=Choloepus didactylus TaxID=27675 RepID=UPI00189D343D|nr:cytochrome c oxidase assembly factor 4 homolog, mitochondrial-like [Choloepus didactylus]
MSASVPKGHTWARKVKKEVDEDLLDQLISHSGCAASRYAVQEVWAFGNCISEQQARQLEELQRKED